MILTVIWEDFVYCKQHARNSTSTAMKKGRLFVNLLFIQYYACFRFSYMQVMSMQSDD
jgi:hypothetical protein